MNWLIRKLFLVKEIVSQTGVLHFQRYRLLSIPRFKIYVHRICQSDQDRHFHDHPWDFVSFMLWGSYREFSSYPAQKWQSIKVRVFSAGNLVVHRRADAHRIQLLTPSVWTLVFVFGKTYPWGYQTERGWMEHEQYRQWKHKGFP